MEEVANVSPPTEACIKLCARGSLEVMVMKFKNLLVVCAFVAPAITLNAAAYSPADYDDGIKEFNETYNVLYEDFERNTSNQAALIELHGDVDFLLSNPEMTSKTHGYDKLLDLKLTIENQLWKLDPIMYCAWGTYDDYSVKGSPGSKIGVVMTPELKPAGVCSAAVSGSPSTIGDEVHESASSRGDDSSTVSSAASLCSLAPGSDFERFSLPPATLRVEKMQASSKQQKNYAQQCQQLFEAYSHAMKNVWKEGGMKALGVVKARVLELLRDKGFKGHVLHDRLLETYNEICDVLEVR